VQNYRRYSELLSLTTVMSVYGGPGKEISTHGRLAQNKTQVPSQSGQSIDEQIGTWT